MRILALILLLVFVVVFAVQNAGMVSLQLLAWQLQASLAVIIVLCIAIGALAALLSLGPALFRHRSAERRLQGRVAELEHEQVAPATSQQHDLPVRKPPQAAAR